MAWPMPTELECRPFDVLSLAETQALARQIVKARIPAISVRQPWAHYIMHFGKDIENRRRRTSYRGWVMLHAGQRALVGASPNMPRGAIIGLVEILDCVTTHESDWFLGPIGLVLGRRIGLVAPVTAKGRPELIFLPRPPILAEVANQLHMSSAG